jgi:hypothetical protein
VTQVEEHLPSKQETLSSNPNTRKKKKKKKQADTEIIYNSGSLIRSFYNKIPSRFIIWTANQHQAIYKLLQKQRESFVMGKVKGMGELRKRR